MEPIPRRGFLESTLAGAATLLTGGSALFAQSPATNPAPAPAKPLLPSALSPVNVGHPLGFDTLILTWKSDPTSTLVVQWVGPETKVDKSIHYMKLDGPKLEGTVLQIGKTVTKPYPNTDRKVHRCELAGLTPGAEYRFQIGTSSPKYRFRTLPAKATDTFQFVSGGDCGVNSHTIATNILAAKQEPYFALIGGDLAYDNGRAPETFTQFLRNYHTHMVDAKGRLIPLISCIGNHEVIGGYKGKRADAPQYLSLFDGLFRETTFGVLDIGDYLSIVLLDSGHIEPVAGRQADWLARALAARQERPHLIVANHVPAYPSFRVAESSTTAGAGTGEDQRQNWAPLFERYNVDVVLEHHDHTFKRTFPLINGLKDKHGVMYLGDGSWGRLRPLAKGEPRPYLAAVSSAYHMTVHRLEGDQRFHVALEESGKLADVCHTVSKRPAKRG